ncbi:hypothetical protein, partial [Anaerotignum sp.]
GRNSEQRDEDFAIFQVEIGCIFREKMGKNLGFIRCLWYNLMWFIMGQYFPKPEKKGGCKSETETAFGRYFL